MAAAAAAIMSKKPSRHLPVIQLVLVSVLLFTGLVLLGLIYAEVHTWNHDGPAPAPAMIRTTNCSGTGTTLTASKTAATYEIQTDTYTWEIMHHSATAECITIPRGECAFLAPMVVDAVRMLSSRTTRTIINGSVTVTNGGAVATTALVITDMLQVQSACTTGGFVDFYASVIDVSARPVLLPGETWSYPYELDTALMTGYDASCNYRNAAFVTITNHAGWLPGCPGQCPGPDDCPFGPGANGGGVKADVIPSTGVTVIEIHEEVAIRNLVLCPAGFNCTSLPAGDVLIPTPDVCTFDGTFAQCVTFVQVCNVNVTCDTNVTVVDYFQLVSLNEATPLVITSNRIESPVCTGPCPVGCTLTIGYWKTHAGFTGNNADRVTQYLPITLGCPPPQYAKGANVTSAAQSTAILTFSALAGGAANGLNKVAAQLLATKLNVANGAAVSPTVVAAMNGGDSYLCQYGFNAGAWTSLSNGVKSSINQVATALDTYNNGLAGDGVTHC